MKLTDRMLFMLAELTELSELLKLSVDRAVDKTADRIVCETAMIDRTVENKCVSCRKASMKLESV